MRAHHRSLRNLNSPLSSPPPIGGYIAWYDASQLVGQSDNTSLGTWPDLSGNSHNLTSSDGSGGKGFYHNATGTLIGGKPIVAFSASLNNTQNMKSASFTVNNPISIAVVCTYSGTQTWAQPIVSDESGSNYILGFDSSGVISTYTGFWATYGTTPSVAAHSFIWTWTGATQFVYYDGTQLTATGTTNPTGGISLGLNIASDQGSDGYQGSIGEIILYPSALSTGDAASLHSYFSSKWGTP